MTIPATEALTLPQHKGRPVPWVTRWTQERDVDQLQVSYRQREDGGLAIHYPDGVEDRDEAGVLWRREGLAQGKGEPMWKDVSTLRQRACMWRTRCQVCGRKIEDNPVHWLMPLDTLVWLQDEVHTEPTPVTANAPTCAGCVPLALELCPNLKAMGWELYHVLSWGLWGVRGQHYYVGEGRIQRRNSLVPYDTSGYEGPIPMGATLAQQAVVVWGNFTKKLEHRPKVAVDG